MSLGQGAWGKEKGKRRTEKGERKRGKGEFEDLLI
jgi:hypothetical protein